MKTTSRDAVAQRNLVRWALRYGHQNKQAKKSESMSDRKRLVYVETRLLLSALRYFEKRQKVLRKRKP